MAIVGSSFTKIKVERLKPLKGKVNINNNVSIKDITKAEMNTGNDKEAGMRFDFTYSCMYEPEIGNIDIEGELLIIEEAKKAEDILKMWKDKKEVPKEYMTGVLNAVLNKCNVQALIMSQTMNLPPPIPMPKISAEAAVPEKKTKK